MFITDRNRKRVLELLSRQFPDIASATAEIINLNAILQLPKGTEHFISDLHGEYEAFRHLLRNASGIIRIKMDEVFGCFLTREEKNALATLIYYPEERLSHLKKSGELSHDWYRRNLSHLVELCRGVCSKYTRSKVRKALPKEFSYIIEELLWEQKHFKDKEHYYHSITETILQTGRADAFLVALSFLIQRLSVDKLYILGDIFDRGPAPHRILDTLSCHHNTHITWGNHDMLWMGAASGNLACIASVIRICARYHHLEILEKGYGISLRQLIAFSDSYRQNNSCACFLKTKNPSAEDLALAHLEQTAMLLQCKAEADILRRHPEYEMEDRLLLSQIHPQTNTITIRGKSYSLCDGCFSAMDFKNPFVFTEEETEILEKLQHNFLHSPTLQNHIRFLYAKGGMYCRENGNLMYHGCIPLNSDGSFASFLGYSGKALLDYCDQMARKGYFLPADHPEKKDCRDFFWYLWCGKHSPLFGKEKMATFERYFVEDTTLHKEEKNPYYHLMDSQTLAETILAEFGLFSPHSRLINGHVPVKQKEGESPVKAGGKLFVIDGGLSPAYQAGTGIAGYTLISNSHGFLLTAHQPFSSKADAVANQTDMISAPIASASFPQRMKVSQTDTGKELATCIEELSELVDAYRTGLLQAH